MRFPIDVHSIVHLEQSHATPTPITFLHSIGPENYPVGNQPPTHRYMNTQKDHCIRNPHSRQQMGMHRNVYNLTRKKLIDSHTN